MSKTYSNLTGAELLRADPYSQKIDIVDENGNSKSLVNKQQFWGNKSTTEVLYYDYKDQANHGWSVQRDGWNDYSQDKSQHLNPEETGRWVDTKVFCDNMSTLSVIQGYAGCGKTIFVNSLLQEHFSTKNNISYNDVYVDYDNNAAENGYLPSAIRNHIITQIIECLLKDDGWEIYNIFIDLLNKYSVRSASFSDFLGMFRKDGQISKLAQQLHTNRENHIKISSIETDFRMQFISGSMAISGALKGKLYYKGDIDVYDLVSIDEQHIRALLESYLLIDFILLFAINMVRKQSTGIVFYDNLDIIDNPQHIAFFINKLQEVLYKIAHIFNKVYDTVPVFNVILAVRKITFALVSSFVEVRDPERGFDAIHVNFLDISNLYSSTKLLKHKAIFLTKHLDDFIPSKYNRTEVSDFLNALIQIPEKVLDEICLPDLFNHNIRACANILERAMQHSSHIIPKKSDISKMSDKCNSAIWIHNICSVLNENEIWSNMGYNTTDSSIVHYPTTLSRLILTYLYNQRREFRNGTSGFETTEVSFKEIIEMFEKLPFSSFPNNHRNIPEETERNYSKESSRNKIISALSYMLKRNTASDGINPKNEMELWRRPIYFTKNAFSLTDKSGYDNVQNELSQQIKRFDQPDASITDFCITDEGYTFIEKIATNFEFYSVRYNGKYARPLCYLTDINMMDKIINNVYLQVKKCIQNHDWFMEYYIKKYGKSQNNPNSLEYKNDLNQYFSQMFHPRTEGNKPQLHIVRTIYDHIYYLNDYRDYLIETNHVQLNELNKCLVKWIGKYLDLYGSNLYELLNNTVGSFNEVFLDLKYLYWRVYSSSDYLPCIDDSNRKISICRSDAWIRKSSKVSINDKTLISNPMLII